MAATKTVTESASYEEAIAKLSQIVISEESDLRSLAAEKIMQLSAQLEAVAAKEYNPILRIDAGFHHFKTQIFEKYPEIFEQLATAQNPKFLTIGCSDSRVSSSHVLNFKLGESFMIRNIANIVPPYDKIKYADVGAVLEYAIKHLYVENILVMGHSRCGGIQGLMDIPADGTTTTDFVEEWVLIVKAAKERVLAEYPDATAEEQCYHCEKKAVNESLWNLLSYPFVREALQNKALTLFGAHYDFVNCILDKWTFDLNSAAAARVSQN